VEVLLRELHALVENSNIKAADVAEKLASLLIGTEYAGHLKRASAAIESYDFDKVPEVLESLADKLNVNL
jgi:hypothetical protein